MPPGTQSFVIAAVILTLATTTASGVDDHFEESIRPLLSEHCFRCHGADKQKGGLRVDSREALLAGGDSGAAIVPGKPEESLFVQALKHDGLKMPPSKQLPDEQIAVLAKWIKDGAVWGGRASKTGGASGHAARKPGLITDDDRKWWAFQKPLRPEVPGAGGNWARTPIDHFIAQRLNAEQVSHAGEADRQTLIRRLTFDLIGLPPAPAEVTAFVEDRSPDAYEKLVEKLLASPRYGERQARAWLDVVRYAESDGYRADAARPHAWRYRDYVIRAFNADTGYDRFVREQLAGDELYPNDPNALIATGYFRLGQYEYNQKDVRGQWAAIQNDITDVTADAFLALGLGCARCHDHKFDPVLQKDYFSLQSFFAGLRFVDEPVFPSAAARAEYEAELAAWDAKTAPLREKMAALLGPVLAKIQANAGDKYPPEIQAVIHKPAAERTPGERQLYELAMRQVRELELDRAPSRLGKHKDEYDALKKELDAATKPVAPMAMVARDLGPDAAEVLIPGGRKKAVAAEPAFPVVLGASPPLIRARPDSTGRRAALAEWLTSKDHPLTARVMVNRIWQGHFGTGLVATASDFGTLGEKPSHPELLDWLAVEFVEHGWSLKHIHRLIVTSAVYRQASVGSAKGAARTADPENRLLSRMSVRRLDAEQVRDAMLATSGELKLDAGGPAVPAAAPRRSIYTRVLRNSPDPLIASFDAADGISGCARRNITVTPTQALLLMNGTGTLARAEAFAARVMPADGKDAAAGVTEAYRRAFGRSPTTEEAAEALEFLKQQVGLARNAVTPDSRRKGWTDFCHSLLNANEFLYID
ncbi:PSD1 and planctomycete cytochrome C domain-containing protein [Gemmata sp.]|uniref:PSD1 and planctomycete cytochrome C domain-containing protein n=1 Tax=Gemmata sp. TaxID=1914242 RepID=UPI003F71D84A